jgi:hypothetical protein
MLPIICSNLSCTIPSNFTAIVSFGICLDWELNVFTGRLVIPGDYTQVCLVWSNMRSDVTAFDVTSANGSKVNLLKMIRLVRVGKIVNSRGRCEKGKHLGIREKTKKMVTFFVRQKHISGSCRSSFPILPLPATGGVAVCRWVGAPVGGPSSFSDGWTGGRLPTALPLCSIS